MSYIYNADAKDATKFTHNYNTKLLENRDQEQYKIECEDVENTKSHLILKLEDKDIYDDDGNIIYDCKKYPLQQFPGFPDTVNPYLWQINKDNTFAGILKMAEGYYVASGIDISMIGFIKSDNGWIIVDCGNYINSAQTALKLAEKAVGENIHDNIKAVIYSHSHLDHYGGAGAFITQEQAGNMEDGKIPVIAPGDYEQSLVDDNLYAGIAMSRRLQYQGGMFLKRGVKGSAGAGLHHPLGIRGEMSMILPTWQVFGEETVNIDGITLTFIPSPDTETRSHMCVYSNTHKVLYLGDNAMGTIHNTYTPRGARVRDASFWGGLFFYLHTKFGKEVCAIYQGHGVAHFKMEQRPGNLEHFLLDNAAAYKFPSDQALLLANKGVKLNEAGNEIVIPDEISKTWYTRDHYGNYTFNARGAIQRYLGFYDGNPVNLLPLPEKKFAAKLIEYMGSEDLILEKAEKDYENGEYQWVATITNHLVFNNPGNMRARYLCADALEQLGYQAITGLWRNMYLCGAYELRHPGAAAGHNIRYMDNKDVMPYVSASLILDYLGINYDGEKAVNIEKEFIISIKDSGELYLVHLYKGTVFYTQTDGSRKDGLPVLNLSKTELYELATKTYKEDSPALSKEAGEIIAILKEYVTDTSKYKGFNIIEPLCEEN
jgi:Alkyl sulfatase and related hydrolases